ncbi:hypothetical protein HDU83_004566 [Entophlyctis luteolus]|nr:hypothetical protein HDU83_004566 [Entophlyctis luteolus]
MLRQENLDLERRNELLTRDLQRVEDALAKETKYGREVGVALSEEKARYMTLSETVHELQNEMKEKEVQMVSQRHRLLSKNIEEEEFRAQLKDKNLEVNKYLSEIKSLTTQNTQLSAEIDTIGQELEATVSEIERNAREMEEMQAIIANNDVAIDQITEERDSLKIKVEELSEKLQSRDDRTSEIIQSLHIDVEYLKNRVIESESNQTIYRNENLRLHEELTALKTTAAAVNEDALQIEIRERDEIIVSLRAKLAEAYKDFEVLSLDWDRIDSLVKDKAGGEIEGLKSQAALAGRLREKIELFKERHSADEAKMKQLQKQADEKEEELIELRQRMSAYESGIFGLKESIREAKQLKLEKSIRDKEIQSLTLKINDFEQQVSDFVEENEELRLRLGIQASTKIDLSNVKSIKAVELEKAKGLVIQLQKEVDELEKDRMKLKESLRLQAISRGERAVAMGLGVEELTAVEEYAAKLRGKDNSPVDLQSVRSSRPVLNNVQLEKLTIELERVHVEAAETREKLESSEKEIRRMQAENRALETVVKEVSMTLIKTRGVNTTQPERSTDAPSDGDQASVRASCCNEFTDRYNQFRFPVIEKLLKALDRKQQKDLSKDLYGLDNVEENVVQVNRTLREELMTMRIKMQELETQVELSKKAVENSQRNAEILKLRAMRTRGKALELPTELLLGSVHDYSSVVEQLVDCLMELEVKDRELRTARKSLETFEQQYGFLAGKQRHLYRDYHQSKKSAAEEIKKLKQDLDEAVSETEASKIRISELETLVSAIHERSDFNKTQKALIDSQRAVTVLKVNEMNLKRKYMAATDVEQNVRKENMKLKSDLIAVDRVARETISRILQGKTDESHRVETLENLLRETVPKSDFKVLQNQLELYVSKTKVLLEREINWISERDHHETESKNLVLAKQRIEDLELELHEAIQNTKHIESALSDLSTIRGKEKLGDAHQKIIKLEVAQDVLQKRADISENKCKALESNENQLKQRIEDLERTYLETTEANIQLREMETQLRNTLENAVVKEDHEKVVKEHANCKETMAKLQAELSQYKDVADIASNQTADLLHHQSQNEKEKAILRATIQELQMEGDEKLLIGKLHHHILALQMNESAVIRKLELQQAKCIRLESRVVKLERAIDERDAALFQHKIDSRNSLRLLQKAVSSMRVRIVGQVTLEKHQRTCTLAQSLDKSNQEMKENFKRLLEQQRETEAQKADKVSEHEQTINSLSELVESLRDSSSAAERIVSWQSRMATLQIANLRLRRDLDAEVHAKLAAQASLDSHLDRVKVLEDALCEAQINLDDKQLEWENRQEDMECIIKQLEDEREKIFQAASLADLKHSLPDRSLPISHQLEAALRMLIERSRLLTAQEIKIANLEGKIESLKEKVGESKEKIAEKDAHITELRIDVARHDLRAGEGLSEYDNKTRELVRRREGEAMRSAQEVVNSLQRQLAKKEELIERYRETINEKRKEITEHKEESKKEIQKLTEIVNTLNDRQVNKLKTPYEVPQQLLSSKSEMLVRFLVCSDLNITVRQQNIDQILELENILKLKSEELASLQQKYTLLKDTHNHHLETAHTELQNLRHELSLRNATLHESETLIENLKRSLHEHKEELALAAEAADEAIKCRGLQEHVAKLNREIAKRDAKIVSMKSAIDELKEALVKTAEEVAEKKIRGSMESLNTDTDEGPLRRITQLEARIDK